MKVGLGEGGNHRRATEAFLPLPPLDPANLVAKRSGHTDVVVLALSDVQSFLFLVAEGGLAAPGIGKEHRIGLRASGLVESYAVVERIAERVRIGREGGAIRVGHGHET